jgi:low molecular weight phosphotyrosine protein phosphatase
VGVNVLFVCVANSSRSVMAEQLFRRAADGRHQARSVGSDPGNGAHPRVVEALKEIGIDASAHVPRSLDQDASDGPTSREGFQNLGSRSCCGSVVLVYEAAESVAALDLAGGRWIGRVDPMGWLERESSVGTLAVVMHGVGA